MLAPPQLLHRLNSRLTDADDVELKAALQQLLLDLVGDAVEADVALGVHRRLLGLHCRRHCCSVVGGETSDSSSGVLTEGE